MKIRSYRAEDTLPLAILFQRAVREIGSRDYSPAQVEAWTGGTVEQRVTHRRDFEVNGVPVHNYAMEKQLSPPQRGGAERSEGEDLSA